MATASNRVRCLVVLALIALALPAAELQAQTSAQSQSSIRSSRPSPPIDTELLRSLQQWAVKLAELPPPAQWPALHALPAAQLASVVCPDRPRDCRTLIAVYDTDRRDILYRDALDLNDPTDQSYIVHELVHYLQHLRDGDALFSTCQRALAAETEAYAAQNRYLAHFRQWRRAGEMLRFTHCASPSANLEVRPGEPAVLTSRSPHAH